MRINVQAVCPRDSRDSKKSRGAERKPGVHANKNYFFVGGETYGEVWRPVFGSPHKSVTDFYVRTGAYGRPVDFQAILFTGKRKVNGSAEMVVAIGDGLKVLKPSQPPREGHADMYAFGNKLRDDRILPVFYLRVTRQGGLTIRRYEVDRDAVVIDRGAYRVTVKCHEFLSINKGEDLSNAHDLSRKFQSINFMLMPLAKIISQAYSELIAGEKVNVA